MNAYKYDRCGKYFEPRLTITEYELLHNSDVYVHKSMDLCDQCHFDLKNWFEKFYTDQRGITAHNENED